MSERSETNVDIDRLVKLRKQADMSQAELARAAGVTPAAISLIEKGDREPTLTTALKISDALNVSVYALVGRFEYPYNETTVRCELTKAEQRLSKIKQLAT